MNISYSSEMLRALGFFSRKRLQKLTLVGGVIIMTYFALSHYFLSRDSMLYLRSHKNIYRIYTEEAKWLVTKPQKSTDGDLGGKTSQSVDSGRVESTGDRNEANILNDFSSTTKVNIGMDRKEISTTQRPLNTTSSSEWPKTDLTVERENNKSTASLESSRASLIIVTPPSMTTAEAERLTNTTALTFKDKVRRGRKIPEGHGLHSHIWYGICSTTIQSMCHYPLFPKAPDIISVVGRLKIQFDKLDFGHRIFGYISPPVTGMYRFAVSSDDSSEVWLSTNEDCRNSRKICHVGERNETSAWTELDDFDSFSSQKSKPIELQKGRKYFLEIVHIQGGYNDGFQLVWKIPERNAFEVVDHRSTLLMKNISRNYSKAFDSTIIYSIACPEVKHQHLQRARLLRRVKPRHVTHNEVLNALTYCTYKPSYLTTGPLPAERWLFLAQYLIPTYKYPWVNYPGVENLSLYIYKDHPLDYKDAREIVEAYMEKLEAKYPGKFHLLNIISVEKKIDHEKGYRFLLDLNVTVKGDSKPVIISEYIYKNKTDGKLCYPENLQWDQQANITFVITLRNQGSWMAHFLDNLEEMYAYTGDQHVSLVVFDYESEDFDAEAELKARRIPPYKVMKKKGIYSRTESVNAAVRMVDVPHTIIFTLDLHLELPFSLFTDIRKHCFEGRSVYTPIIARLRCGHSPLNRRGRWEAQGFGLIGIYKSDWDRIGGLDEEKFKHKWGGEDWDMMERVVGGTLEYERVRNDDILHYQHTRNGMWTGDKNLKQISD